MNDAYRDLFMGLEYPYNGKKPESKAEKAVAAILYNLGDRKGIGDELESVNSEIKEELSKSLVQILEEVYGE